MSVFLADDHPITRAGIRAILAQVDNFVIVEESNNGFNVSDLVTKLRPNILLLDLRMPRPQPSEIEKCVHEHYSDAQTLVLTAQDRHCCLATMIDAGAIGYLIKDEFPVRTISTIRRAAQGEKLFDDEQLSRADHGRRSVGEKAESY